MAVGGVGSCTDDSVTNRDVWNFALPDLQIIRRFAGQVARLWNLGIWYAKGQIRILAGVHDYKGDGGTGSMRIMGRRVA